jgi:mannose-6-phosphate isomerase-like protein (cupin superfamily)
MIPQHDSSIFTLQVAPGCHFLHQSQSETVRSLILENETKSTHALPPSTLPPDDLSRDLVIASAEDAARPHIGLVGDTYTVLVSGKDTAGGYCLIDMHIPPGGGPPPHRHNFEETFVVMEGQIDATFRGHTSTVKNGQTIHIPANAPHQFTNAANVPARLLCICSPAGQEDFFAKVGVLVETRDTPPPALDPAERRAMGEKASALAPQYVTEMLPSA